ncbi:hypothetical protein Hanom_Chr17g01556971 [Helianthus anomalus]
MLPVDGTHAASCEEIGTTMSSAESAAYKGLQQCIETVMAEVELPTVSHPMMALFLITALQMHA